MTRQEYLETLVTLIKPKVISTLTDYIFKKYPGLTFPILQYFTNLIVNKVIELAFEKTELLIYFKHVDLRTSQEGKDFYSKALINAEAQRTGTDEQKEIAKRNLIESFNTFVRLN